MRNVGPVLVECSNHISELTCDAELHKKRSRCSGSKRDEEAQFFPQYSSVVTEIKRFPLFLPDYGTGVLLMFSIREMVIAFFDRMED